jgi:hypothetical protein
MGTPHVSDANPRSLYPVDDGSSVEASDSLQVDLARLARYRAEYGLLKDLIELTERPILEAMGAAGELVDSAGQVLATWKSGNPVHAFDIERFQTDHAELAARYLVPRSGPRRLLLSKKP